METNDPRLDYIKIIAHRFAIVPDNMSDEELEKGESEYAKILFDKSDFRVAEHFSERYETLLNEHKDKYSLYKENEDIQNYISSCDLDSEKMWTTILFVYDFVEESFLHATNKPNLSAKEEAEKILKKFGKDITEITIKSNKREYTVQNECFNEAFYDLLTLISKSSKYDEFVDINDDDDGKFTYSRIGVNSKLAFFTKMLLYLLNNYCQSKNSSYAFIAKIAYIFQYLNNDAETEFMVRGYKIKDKVINDERDKFICKKDLNTGKYRVEPKINTGEWFRGKTKDTTNYGNIIDSSYTYTETLEQ